MGSKLPEGVKRKDLFLVPVDLIEVRDEENYTKGSRGNIEDLALSIATEGIQNPIKCYRNGEGEYIVNAGFRRMAAVSFINDNPDVFETPIERVPVMLEERYANEADRAIRQLLENSHREDATPIEKAQAYRKLLEVHGLDIEEVANRLGERSSTVKRFLSLLEASQPVRNALKKGQIAPTAAAQIVRKSKGDEGAQKKALDLAIAAGGGKATDKAVTKVTRQRAPRQRTKSVVEVKEAITTVETRIEEAKIALKTKNVSGKAIDKESAAKDKAEMEVALRTLKWTLGADKPLWS
jgi:ParB/RepB/Spo0J family partition protein